MPARPCAQDLPEQGGAAAGAQTPVLAPARRPVGQAVPPGPVDAGLRTRLAGGPPVAPAPSAASADISQKARWEHARFPAASAAAQRSIRNIFTVSSRSLFLRAIGGPMSGAGLAPSRGPRGGASIPSASAAPIAATPPSVGPRSRIALAHAETSRLLACRAAATPAWETPPFAGIRGIFLLSGMGAGPFPFRGARPSGALPTDSRSGAMRADSRYHRC